MRRLKDIWKLFTLATTLALFGISLTSCSTIHGSVRTPDQSPIEIPEIPQWTPLGDTSCFDDMFLVCLDVEQTRILNDNLLRLTSWARQCEEVVR